MEKENKRGVIVGAFVFLALVIFVLGVMTLGGQKSLFNKGATIHAKFDEVSGLQPGNNVQYAGVKVGTVEDITFDKNGLVDVAMNIKKDVLSLIKKNARAKVGSEGFIGNKMVVIYGGTPNAPVVENGSTLTVDRTISTEEMMDTLQKNNRNLMVITNNFRVLTDRMVNGEGSIAKLLNDEQLFRDLQQSTAAIKLAAAHAQIMATNFSNYTNRLTTKGALANDLVTDTVIFSRLRNTVREIDALSATASRVVDDLNAASKEIKDGVHDPSTAIGSLLHDKETAADLKATIKNLQASSQKLDENMEALQHNFLLRGFFKKKRSQ